ncbi:phenylacetic acid degradation operon negative regulatory protein PaaX [Massilia eurypsychrophila]|jgi:phenylacetic acid degradation operon negative regulatory protein|uniref:Phenylacetic acid degradation operon negative regulatory protein PaaX n=1 Tax=Massilia eurypsychrophila TaxID=1485217 RepID=A0A2G8TJM4_9BURK|nr:PaaX family transcriptional regulator C-terminal domain-containing protein [Massilia eurypsychrophila]PIL46247.1 phenylacetic acid degradation operon negative regulatory protein PaaX [Massilia eurypsychrophila]
MKQWNSTEWIAHFLASDPPRSKSLVMTIFGDAIAPHGGTVWLGSLIELLAPFGVNDRLLRTSVFRLAQEGWLVASRDRRRSAYAILPQAQPRFERANRRIYAPLEVHWDGHWTLLLASGGQLEAPLRAALRKELLWEGYALVTPGVFGHPAADIDVLRDILERLGAGGKLFACRATELPGVAGRPLPELVGDGWDLSGVSAGYQQFIDRFEPLLGLPAPMAPQQAFVIRTLLIHAYRRVQLHDPMLPVELLPDPWPGARAYELARALYRQICAAAEEHVMAAMLREDDGAAPADAGFFERFGGLQ